VKSGTLVCAKARKKVRTVRLLFSSPGPELGRNALCSAVSPGHPQAEGAALRACGVSDPVPLSRRAVGPRGVDAGEWAFVRV
jgi:hypothetical protein